MEERDYRRSIFRKLFLYAVLFVVIVFGWLALEGAFHISGVQNLLAFLFILVLWFSFLIVSSLLQLRRLSSSTFERKS